jgi:magnesium-transporting ATPase (P-type)
MSDSHYYLANRPQTTTDADCDIESGAQTATTATQPSNLQRPAKRLWSKATVLTLFFTQLLLSLLLLLYAIWCRLSLPLSSRNWSRAENNANILTITAASFSLLSAVISVTASQGRLSLYEIVVPDTVSLVLWATLTGYWSIIWHSSFRHIYFSSLVESGGDIRFLLGGSIFITIVLFAKLIIAVFVMFGWRASCGKNGDDDILSPPPLSPPLSLPTPPTPPTSPTSPLSETDEKLHGLVVHIHPVSPTMRYDN